MYLTISTSTNPNSRSFRLAKLASDTLSELVSDVKLVDMTDYDLPLDNGSTSKDPSVGEICDFIGKAEGIILVVPIYRGGVSIATRNLVQLCGTNWQRKVIGLVSVAGEAISHAVAVDFAAGLMLEHRNFIVPDFVFVESKSLSGKLTGSKVDQKIQKMVRCLVRVTESLKRA